MLRKWLEKIKINEDAVNAIEERSVKGEEIERIMICMDVLDGLMSKISEATEVTSIWSPLVKGRIEVLWSSKAYIIYEVARPAHPCKFLLSRCYRP